MPRNASAVASPGSSPVHASATGCPSVSAPPSTSVTIGPCRVDRTSRTTSSEPRTLIRSVRVWTIAAASSRYRSCTSGSTLVRPQAMRALWPMMTPGTPGSVAPDTERPGASRRARYQTEGVRSPRCGSFARRGLPDFVRDPPTTQELLPISSPLNPRAASRPKDPSSEDHGPRDEVPETGVGGRVAGADRSHPLVIEKDRRLFGDGRKQLPRPLGADGFQEARAPDLVSRVAGQVPGHHLCPGQAVHRREGLDSGAQDANLRRTRAVCRQEGVEAARVGFDQLPGLRRQSGPAGLGRAAEPDRPKELVRVDERTPQDLGETAASDTALELHLPEAVLGVRVAEAEKRVLGRGRANRGHAVRIPLDRDGRRKAGDAALTLLAGKRRRRQPREARGERDDQDQSGHENLPHGGRGAYPRGRGAGSPAVSNDDLPKPRLSRGGEAARSRSHRGLRGGERPRGRQSRGAADSGLSRPGGVREADRGALREPPDRGGRGRRRGDRRGRRRDLGRPRPAGQLPGRRRGGVAQADAAPPSVGGGSPDARARGLLARRGRRGRRGAHPVPVRPEALVSLGQPRRHPGRRARRLRRPPGTASGAARRAGRGLPGRETLPRDRRRGLRGGPGVRRRRPCCAKGR